MVVHSLGATAWRDEHCVPPQPLLPLRLMEQRRTGQGLAMGVALGIVFGAIFGNVGLGIAFGAAFGAACGSLPGRPSDRDAAP